MQDIEPSPVLQDIEPSPVLEEEWALIERILDHLQNEVQSTDNWNITAVE